MKLSKEDYREAKDCLKKYNYNCLKISFIRADIIGIGSPVTDGMPKAPYTISDSVLNTLIKLQEDKKLQSAIIKYKAVVQAVEVVSNDSRKIFIEQYQQNKSKWDIINSGMSEGTYKRRHSELVNAVHKELEHLKKVSQN